VSIASGCTENKGLLTDQAQPLSEASLSRQQAFATPCVNSHCFMLAALLRKVDTRQDSWHVLPESLTFTGYCLLGSLEPDCWLTPAFLPHSPALAKALQLAAQAFSTAMVTAASAQARLLHWLASPPFALRTAFTLRFLLKQCHYCKQTFDGSCTMSVVMVFA